MVSIANAMLDTKTTSISAKQLSSSAFRVSLLTLYMLILFLCSNPSHARDVAEIKFRELEILEYQIQKDDYLKNDQKICRGVELEIKELRETALHKEVLRNATSLSQWHDKMVLYPNIAKVLINHYIEIERTFSLWTIDFHKKIENDPLVQNIKRFVGAANRIASLIKIIPRLQLSDGNSENEDQLQIDVNKLEESLCQLETRYHVEAYFCSIRDAFFAEKNALANHIEKYKHLCYKEQDTDIENFIFCNNFK